jgi:hypothetical protein
LEIVLQWRPRKSIRAGLSGQTVVTLWLRPQMSLVNAPAESRIGISERDERMESVGKSGIVSFPSSFRVRLAFTSSSLSSGVQWSGRSARPRYTFSVSRAAARKPKIKEAVQTAAGEDGLFPPNTITPGGRPRQKAGRLPEGIRGIGNRRGDGRTALGTWYAHGSLLCFPFLRTSTRQGSEG